MFNIDYDREIDVFTVTLNDNSYDVPGSAFAIGFGSLCAVLALAIPILGALCAFIVAAVGLAIATGNLIEPEDIVEKTAAPSKLPPVGSVWYHPATKQYIIVNSHDGNTAMLEGYPDGNHTTVREFEWLYVVEELGLQRMPDDWNFVDDEPAVVKPDCKPGQRWITTDGNNTRFTIVSNRDGAVVCRCEDDLPYAIKWHDWNAEVEDGLLKLEQDIVVTVEVGQTWRNKFRPATTILINDVTKDDVLITYNTGDHISTSTFSWKDWDTIVNSYELVD